ncbi:MAG: lytic transglycosylase domain-containing protein, partial [Clostridia bacterium]
SFRPEAVSSAGAVGLMQIMPQTGKWVAEKLGEGDYQLQKLTDPETNIRYGCWYLNYLNGRFDEDMTKVTAAYHAGGGRVNEWLEDEANSKDGKKLSNIPSDVTRAYVKNVYAAYEKYKEIMSA